MQFTINARLFLQALRDINVGHHMHRFVLLWAKDGKLTIRATTRASDSRYDTTPHLRVVRSLVPLTLGQEGAYAVHYRQLIHALAFFPGTIEVRQEEQVLLVRGTEGPHMRQTPIESQSLERYPHGSFHAEKEGTCYTKERSERVQCAACQEWHIDRTIETYQVVQVFTQRVQVKQEMLLTMVKHVAWIADNENGRHPAFRGVCMSVTDTTISLSATNNYCVVMCSKQFDLIEPWSQKTLIPAKLFYKALRLFPTQAEILIEAVLERHQRISVESEEKEDSTSFVQPVLLRLSAEDLQVTLPLFHESPPEYSSVVPISYEMRVVCEAADLLDAVKAALPTRKHQSPAIWLHIQDKEIRVEARREQMSASAIHEIAVVQKTGTDVSLLLNGRYLTKMVQASRSPQVILECGEPEKPIVLRSCENPENVLCVLKPMGPMR